MPGWGRRTGGQIDNKIEDDLLFKEIGGQLDASNFDYSQWQRTGKPEKTAPPQKPEKTAAAPKSNARNAVSHDHPFTVGAGSRLSRLQSGNRRVHSAGSSSCESHGGRKKAVGTPSTAKRQAEAVKILQLRIKARQQTLDEYRIRQLELYQENLKLKKQIEDDEATSHKEVKNLLRKYERFRGGVTTLNTQFLKDLEAAKEDLAETKAKLAEEAAKRNKEVLQVDEVLQAKKEELRVLQNFKDTDYPVKALEISELQRELATLKLTNQIEEDELKEIVQTELKKLSTEKEEKKLAMTDSAMQTAVDTMHPSLKEMATHNLTMEKEIEFHKNEINVVEKDVELLQEEIGKLVKDPKTNIRMMMFPEFYLDKPKCTPDMDVVLDIPTHEWLPI